MKKIKFVDSLNKEWMTVFEAMNTFFGGYYFPGGFKMGDDYYETKFPIREAIKKCAYIKNELVDIDSIITNFKPNKLKDK